MGWLDGSRPQRSRGKPKNGDEEGEAQARLCIVYLSGVASLSGRFLYRRERKFLRQLRERHPDAVVIDNVFPYSPSGMALLARSRLFDRLYRRVQKLQLQQREPLLSALISLRNIFQVLVSSDHRYGPIFNQGTAHSIQRALRARKVERSNCNRIIIIGYSGGGQIAVGAAPFLADAFRADVEVVSIGGVISSDPGLNHVKALHYFYGERDHIQRLGALMFSDRWGLSANSAWNIAKREKRIRFHKMPAVAHSGAKGYYGLPINGGHSNLRRTLDQVSDAIENNAHHPA